MQKDRAHVGLQIHTRKIERKRTDTLRRCRANTRKSDQVTCLVRKLPVPVLYNALGGLVERQSASVVAHPLPSVQNIGRRGLGKRLHSRKTIDHTGMRASTRGTCVCCSMTSESQMMYGSRVRRHGRSR
mgnify:CR=1 FL=1